MKNTLIKVKWSDNKLYMCMYMCINIYNTMRNVYTEKTGEEREKLCLGNPFFRFKIPLALY